MAVQCRWIRLQFNKNQTADVSKKYGFFLRSRLNLMSPKLRGYWVLKVELMFRKVFRKQPPGIRNPVCCKMKRKLQTIYRKNKEDIRALIFEIYPQFVYKNIHRLPENDIPIFVFHSVRPDYFEHQMRYLAENNYTTLTSDELFNIVKGNISSKSNNIALTFDDGLASLWTTAYPILKKFGLSATCFILPSWI